MDYVTKQILRMCMEYNQTLEYRNTIYFSKDETTEEYNKDYSYIRVVITKDKITLDYLSRVDSSLDKFEAIDIK